jgi:predicted DNA-binding transcriptional regulator YafY
MSKREAVARYNLIINKLRKHPASFDEILSYLEVESDIQSYNFVVSLRTFQRDLADILSIYNIEIKYDFSRKVYYINSELQDEVNERILEAFDTFNALNIADRLSNHIHFEKRKPQGTENLYGFLHAIKNKLQTKFSYQKYWGDKLSQRQVEPYALKEFKNRWYVLANDLNDQQIKTFALDRLTNLEITKKRFEVAPGFNLNEHFKYCFGIISPNDSKPHEIVLSFDPFQGKYIKSLPLHDSQEVLIDNEKELRIKLTLFITHDFVMEMLSYGDTMKVIKPQRLISELKNSYKSALELY